MALSQDLYDQCRATLLKCGEFDSNASLRAIFAVAELEPFRDRLREADNRNGRVDMCMEFLPDRWLNDGRSSFALFISQLFHRRDDGDALRDELSDIHSRVRDELEEVPPVEIPFVVAAMNIGEVDALIDGEVFDTPNVAPAERIRFREFREALETYGIDDLRSHYGEKREDWQPYHCQHSTIRDIVCNILDHFNRQQALGANRVLVPSPFLSSRFFSGNEDVRLENWNRLSRKGCILIVDAVSMFHPRLHRVVSRSEMGSNDRVAMLTLSPVNSNTLPVNQLIESHIRSQMQRAFARFDRYLDKLCEFGLGDLRAIQRWLFATLPETAAIVQGRRANPSSRGVVRDRMGSPRGMEDVIFGRRGGR